MGEIEQAIASLADNIGIGTDRGYVRSGYRALRINSHVVYYLTSEINIRIIRVLHGRMDPGKYL